MSVGLAIIARDEEHRLPFLLESVAGAFDRVVLLDTGSTDATIDIFTAWAKDQPRMTYQIGHFEWCDDFSVARTASYNLLMYGQSDHDHSFGPPMVDWTCWADCDDVIHNAQIIRGMCLEAPANVAAFLCGYAYGYTGLDGTGECVSYLWRERMVRAGQSTWDYRVHEAQMIEGGVITPVDPGILEWRHIKHRQDVEDTIEASNSRNLVILRKWHDEEPENARVAGYVAVESLLAGEFEDCLEFYERYFALDPEWTDERAQAHRRYALALLHYERYDDMIDTAWEAIKVHPSWPDSYLTMAEAYLAKGEGAKAMEWARQAMDRGAPQNTLMVINPLDYTFLPRKLLATAFAIQGDQESALVLAREALEIVPDQTLAAVARAWQYDTKRKHTADTMVMMAEQLIAHDEQLKALALLEGCVPYFVVDHPKVVNIRSMLRERLAWVNDPAAFAAHYETGGSKPEDFVPTDSLEKVDQLCEYLPRTNFLLAGVIEQSREAA